MLGFYVQWVYQHPTAARCLLLTSTGALIAGWPGTVAKLVTLVTGIGATKGKGEFLYFLLPFSSPSSSSSGLPSH